NCDPNREDSEEQWPCLCNKNFSFKCGKCVNPVTDDMSCTDNEIDRSINPDDKKHTKCAKGSFSDEKRPGKCSECPKGTFSEEDSSMVCSRCPIFRTTNSVGSTKKTDCNKHDIGSIASVGGIALFIIICLVIIIIIANTKSCKRSKVEATNTYF
ncbi:MAG: hypothetical protein MHPSP_004808, partial [Paramarteilia canceri]